MIVCEFFRLSANKKIKYKLYINNDLVCENSMIRKPTDVRLPTKYYFNVLKSIGIKDEILNDVKKELFK